MYHSTFNNQPVKNEYTAEEKRFLLENSKKMPVAELARIIGRPVDRVMSMCSKIGCGYRSK